MIYRRYYACKKFNYSVPYEKVKVEFEEFVLIEKIDMFSICILLRTLTAHNWQKWKRVFLTCPCHEIYREEEGWSKKLQIYLKNYDFGGNVKFGAISWKIDILSITA